MIAHLRALRIIRPHNIAAAVLCVAVGYAMAGGTGPWPLLLFGAVALVTGAGNVVNDYYDYDIDAINKPGRPLPAGVVSRREAGGAYLALIVAIAVCILALPPLEGGWIAAWAILLHCYSRHFKRMYLFGNLVVSAVVASGFLLGAAAAGNVAAGAVPAGFTFFFVLGRELIKDVEDVAGDRACAARTVAAVSGPAAASRTAAVIFILLAVLFPVPYVTGAYGPGYLAVLLGAVIPILGLAAALSFARRAPGAVSVLLKVGMFFGVAAFYLGARRPGG